GLMIPTFAPPQNPGFEFAHPQQYVTDPVTTQKGYEQELPRQPVPLLSAVLEWKAALPDTMAYIVSFFRQFNGRSGPFLWTPPDPIEDPLGIAPRLSSVSKGFGGSGATRTVQITWRDSVTGGETRASASSSLAVPAGHGIV